MSHAYNFYIACLLLYLIPKIYFQFNYKSALLLGAIIGVLVLIRPTNLIFSLVVLLYGINNPKSMKFRLLWLLNNKFKILFSICIAFSVYSFQLDALVNKINYSINTFPLCFNSLPFFIL